MRDEVCPKCGCRESEIQRSYDAMGDGKWEGEKVSGHGVYQVFKCPECGIEYEVRYTDGAKFVDGFPIEW